MAQIDNITLLSPAISDLGTITGSSEALGAGAANLLKLQPTILWSTLSGVLSANVTLDFGAPEKVQQIFLGYHNGSVDGTIRIRAASLSANLVSTPGFDSGPLPARSFQDFFTFLWGTAGADPSLFSAARNHFLLHLSAAQEFRHWRIDFDDPSNPDSLLRAGRLILGVPWQSLRNPSTPITIGHIDSSELSQTISRRTIINEKPKARVLDFQFRLLEEDDFRNNLDELIRLRGGAKDILAVLRPTAANKTRQEIFYGLMPSAPATITTALKNRTLYTQKFGIRELL